MKVLLSLHFLAIIPKRLLYSGEVSSNLRSLLVRGVVDIGENSDRLRCMKRQWDIEELIEHFTLIEENKAFLENKAGATLLGCALLLKYFEYEARFPSAKYEIPSGSVAKSCGNMIRWNTKIH
jgi:hypothetical protein